MSDCCEYGDEPTDSLEGGEFVDQLCDSQLLKRGSAPRNFCFGAVFQFRYRMFLHTSLDFNHFLEKVKVKVTLVYEEPDVE
jgi:hypothetical protein